jgi:hypothetical protein
MFHPCKFSIHEHSKQWINTTGVDSTKLGFIHWEDRSTILAIFFFLSTYWDPITTKNPTFIYIGDYRNGLKWIPELFPTMNFHFFTSTKVKEMKTTKRVGWRQIKELEKYYNDYLEIHDSIFLFSAFVPTKENTLEMVLDKQMDYIDEINPIHAWLTFDMEKETKKKTMHYLQGFVYWKIWAENTLTWLKPVRKGEKYYNRTWNKGEYRQWVDYQYIFGREISYHNPFTNISEAIHKPSLLNDFDDVAEVVILILYIRKFLGGKSIENIKEKVIELSEKITFEINKGQSKQQKKTLALNRKVTKDLPEDPFRKKLATQTPKEPEQNKITLVPTEKQLEKYKQMKKALEGIKK